MTRIIVALVKFWAKIYSWNTSRRVKKWRTLLYSKWAETAFARVGKWCYIEYPIYIKGGEGICIGDGFNTLPRLRLETYAEHNGSSFSPQLTIGNNVCFNSDCHVGCIGRISIGNNVLFASRVFVTDHFHGATNSRADLLIPPSERILEFKGDVTIEDDVWIGEGVAILPGVTIGKGAVIGANSVVTKDIPPYCIAAGIPAKIIRDLR